MNNKALLIILDGYGEGKPSAVNAVTTANTPFLDKLRNDYPTTLLGADSLHVGLPPHTMGGSEVGHYTMGAGRVVFQTLQEINNDIENQSFFKNPELLKAAENCKKHNSAFHILGMISDQGVHSHIKHLFALLKFTKQQELSKVYIHGITDGRDVSEQSADRFITQINEKIKEFDVGEIATIIGRFYAMDRDKNFDRTKVAMDLYTKAEGITSQDAIKSIQEQYPNVETDYYIKPIVLNKNATFKENDSVIFFNYRSDRAAQLTTEIEKLNNVKLICFGPYSIKSPVLYPPSEIHNNLTEWLSNKGIKQLKLAETEKYAHVTFFFNSQNHTPYKGEDQLVVPSPKVENYEDAPEMNAKAITEKLLKNLKKDYGFIAVNFANCDLVGHSGNMDATVKAVETLDACLQDIVPKAIEENFSIIITADHGNAEKMKLENGEPNPSHTLNKVICIVITQNKIELKHNDDLGLKNIAPTILQLMNIEKPKEMTGKSLITQLNKD